MLQILSIILYVTMLIIAIYSVGRYKNLGGLLKKFGFKETKLGRDILVGLFYAGILVVAATFISSMFIIFGQQEDVAKVPSMLEQVSIAEILIVLCIGSFVEEVFFRGYLQRKTNLLFASFVFAYFHIIYGSFSEIVGAFFLGAILGVCFNRTKNLFVPIFSHLTYNLFIISLLFL